MYKRQAQASDPTKDFDPPKDFDPIKDLDPIEAAVPAEAASPAPAPAKAASADATATTATTAATSATSASGAPPTNAAPPAGRVIHGRVLGPEAIPVPGAAVTLIDTAGRQLDRTLSDGDGRYSVRVPERGSFVAVSYTHL